MDSVGRIPPMSGAHGIVPPYRHPLHYASASHVLDNRQVSAQFPGTKNEQQAYRKHASTLTHKHFLIIYEPKYETVTKQITSNLINFQYVSIVMSSKKKPDTKKRPGSADTMVLILKPRVEDYKLVSPQFPGIKNEQQAYRKIEGNQKPSASTQNRNGMIDNKFSTTNTTSTLWALESKAQFPSIKRNCEDDTKQWKDLNLEKPSLVLPNITSSQGKIPNKETFGTLLNEATNDLSHFVLKACSWDTQSNDILEVKSKGKLPSADAGKFTSGSRPLVRPKTTSLQRNSFGKFTHSVDVSNLVENQNRVSLQISYRTI
ncbi:hypothetical protein Bpfe_026727 [Biomphalaria pfeifferi]|uniref:Uncharacterized protein n=1 Tax=Biomphalaria pfeifferi TaxID=112525 RepID=A0AAD8AZE7_BIOPF|nr:hypothetical protein Bpfe_026727 [Biomphalaria pfeifferi]